MREFPGCRARPGVLSPDFAVPGAASAVQGRRDAGREAMRRMDPLFGAVGAISLALAGAAQAASGPPLAIAQAPPGVVAAPPAPRATACTVATPSSFVVTWPQKIAISRKSAANFVRYNQDGYGSLLVAIQYDGGVRTIVTPTSDIDADLRAVLGAFARKFTIRPRIACGLPAGLFLVQFSVPDGFIRATQIHASRRAPAPAVTPPPAAEPTPEAEPTPPPSPEPENLPAAVPR